jgi:predicted nucleotidyltransferase
MRDELDIVRDVSARLEAAGIAYMLTGSMAMNFYAQPRMTRDIDVVVALIPADVEKLLAQLSGDYYVAPEAVWSSVASESMFNAIHNKTIIKVDFIVRKGALYRQTEFARRKRVELNGFSTWIVSKEDLIISKLDWARDSESDFQFRDIKNLVESGCDVSYIDHWTRELNLESLWRRFRP